MRTIQTNTIDYINKKIVYEFDRCEFECFNKNFSLLYICIFFVELLFKRMSLNKSILASIIVSVIILVTSCSSDPIRKLDELTKERVLRIKTYIGKLNESSNKTKSYNRGKNEKITAYYNDQYELIKIGRELKETSAIKEYNFYFMDNQFIASHHYSNNTAKIKDKCFMVAKEFYYSEGNTIFATQKSSTYKLCSDVEMQKFERITPKKSEAPASIYSDELLIIEKLKTFINQEN